MQQYVTFLSIVLLSKALHARLCKLDVKHTDSGSRTCMYHHNCLQSISKVLDTTFNMVLLCHSPRISPDCLYRCGLPFFAFPGPCICMCNMIKVWMKVRTQRVWEARLGPCGLSPPKSSSGDSEPSSMSSMHARPHADAGASNGARVTCLPFDFFGFAGPPAPACALSLIHI